MLKIWNKHPCWVEPPRIGHYREYPWGNVVINTKDNLSAGWEKEHWLESLLDVISWMTQKRYIRALDVYLESCHCEADYARWRSTLNHTWVRRREAWWTQQQTRGHAKRVTATPPEWRPFFIQIVLYSYKRVQLQWSRQPWQLGCIIHGHRPKEDYIIFGWYPQFLEHYCNIT